MLFLRVIFFLLVFASPALAVPRNFNGWETGSTGENGASSGTYSIQSSVVRTGSYALRANPTTSATAVNRYYCPTTSGSNGVCSSTNTYSGFALRVATRPAANSEAFFRVVDGVNAAKLYVRLNSSGNILVYDSANSLVATGTTTLSNDTWYYIEVYSGTGTSANYEVRINETTELSGTANQLATTAAYVEVGKPSNANSQSVDFYFDDLYLSSTSFMGDNKVLVSKPDANGVTAQWTSGTNASDYQEVDETPPDDSTTYISNPASTTNELHLMSLQDTSTIGITGGTIRAAKAIRKGWEPVSVTSSNKLRTYVSGTTSDTVAANLSTAAATYVKFALQNPNTSLPWTASGFDSLQIGVIEANAVQIRETSLLAMILYAPNFYSAATASNDTAVGTLAWTNPTYSQLSEDGSYASVSTSSGGTTNYLKMLDFASTGLSIPAGSTINGIVVKIKRAHTGGDGSIVDSTVKLVKNGTVVGSNKASASTWTSYSTLSWVTYGSSSDLWGTTWSDTDFGSTTGVVFSASITYGGDVAENAAVDGAQMIVYYTAPSGGSGTKTLLLTGAGS